MLSRPSLGGSDAGLYKAVYDFLPTKRTYTFNIFKTVYGRGGYITTNLMVYYLSLCLQRFFYTTPPEHRRIFRMRVTETG